MENKSKMIIDDSKFKYFLNAIHYCMWLHFLKFEEKNDKIFNCLFSQILKYFFTQKYKTNFYSNLGRVQNDVAQFYNDKRSGFCISWASHWFGYAYSCYPAVISFVLFGVILRFSDDLGNNIAIQILILAVPIVLCYIPLYRAVFFHDRYLEYFKEFEKKNTQWLNKWKKITLIFCIGAIISIIFGITIAFVILGMIG